MNEDDPGHPEGSSAWKDDRGHCYVLVYVFVMPLPYLCLQHALKRGFRAFGADLLEVCQDLCLKARDLGEILVPHLQVGEDVVDQSGIVRVLSLIVEVQCPVIVLDLVLVASRTLADQAVRFSSLDVGGVEGDVGREAHAQRDGRSLAFHLEVEFREMLISWWSTKGLL